MLCYSAHLLAWPCLFDRLVEAAPSGDGNDALALLGRHGGTSHGTYPFCSALQSAFRSYDCGSEARDATSIAPLGGSATLLLSGLVLGDGKDLRAGVPKSQIIAEFTGTSEVSQVMAYPHDIVKAQNGCFVAWPEIQNFTGGPTCAPLARASCRTLVANMSALVKELRCGSQSGLSLRPVHVEVSFVAVGGAGSCPIAILSDAVSCAGEAILGTGESPPAISPVGAISRECVLGFATALLDACAAQGIFSEPGQANEGERALAVHLYSLLGAAPRGPNIFLARSPFREEGALSFLLPFMAASAQVKAMAHYRSGGTEVTLLALHVAATFQACAPAP